MMDITSMYTAVMGSISDVLILSGMISLTISLIVMLVNMVIGAATGKGFNIGLK